MGAIQTTLKKGTIVKKIMKKNAKEMEAEVEPQRLEALIPT